MSIIHDALKKAQQKTRKNTDETPVETTKKPEVKETSPSIYEKLQTKKTNYTNVSESIPTQQENDQSNLSKQPATERKKFNATFISLIVVFSLFIGVFLSFLVVLINQNLSADKPSGSKSSKTNKISKSGLTLSGTMMMGEKRVALIDGEIYELGEFVQGKKITDITLKNVELTDDNGKIIVLDVRKKR